MAGLFAGLIDDAAMFPPEDAALPDAVDRHLHHRDAWYQGMVASFVCTAGRLRSLGHELGRRGAVQLPLSLVVPRGIDEVAAAVRTARAMDTVQLVGVEVPLGDHRIEPALELLTGLPCPSSLEVGVTTLDEHQVHALAPTGVRLKLRTGGTTIDAFATEDELARALVLCAAERQAFKCTAGLHHAVRHRPASTMYEHHGFLNILLAARVAASSSSAVATRAVLAERDVRRIGWLVGELTEADVRAIRALFGSFGTCSVLDPVHDLVDMGLVVAP